MARLTAQQIDSATPVASYGACPNGRRAADRRAAELTAAGAGRHVALPKLGGGYVVLRLTDQG